MEFINTNIKITFIYVTLPNYEHQIHFNNNFLHCFRSALVLKQFFLRIYLYKFDQIDNIC